LFKPLRQPQKKYMNRLKPLSTLIFLLFSVTHFYGHETIHLTKKLQWADLKKDNSGVITEADFDHSMRMDEFGGLPAFYYYEQVSGYFEVTSTVFSNEVSASIPGSFLSNKEKKSIGDSWKVIANVVETSGKWYLALAILPIRLKDDRNFERLLSFDVDIQLTAAAYPSARALSFASSSVLGEGTWFKIAIARDGVYKLDKAFLNELGVPVENVDPTQINIYGNGGQLLPELNSAPRYDDLTKCAIYIAGEADQSFENSDFILFYGKGPDTWREAYDTDLSRKIMLQTKHYYSDSAYYFLKIDDTDPKRIQSLPEVTAAATHTITKFQDYQYLENDLYNLAKSGREFYGEELNSGLTSINFGFNFPNVTTDPASITSNVAVRSMVTASSIQLNCAGQLLTLTPPATNDGAVANFAREDVGSKNFVPTLANTTVAATFIPSNQDALGWIDYITMNATRNLTMSGTQLRYRDSLSVGAGNIGLFQISNATGLYQIWNISDYTTPMLQPFIVNGSVAEYKSSTDFRQEFIAFNNNGYLVPTAVGQVANQNLHAMSNVDLMIISAPEHLAAAEQLAELHAMHGTTVGIATPLQVFNEFSSGNPDVIAFRMLMKMMYDRAASDISMRPQNLLMFGDGDYSKTKGVKNQLGSNILVFETNNSLSPTSSSCSDDYFVFLRDEANGSNLNLLDAGVGRIPASTAEEGIGYVDKVRVYMSENTTSNGGAACIGDESDSPYGPWRNIVVFVADDQDGSGGGSEPGHLNIADEMAEDSLYFNYPEYDVVKIYADAYTQESTPGGERYPTVEDAIRNRVQNGALLIAYTGHGGERGWMHERCLNLSTIANWTNKSKLPVFFTATCELAKYDDPEFNTAGELLVMNPNGGAIAMFTTTRIVYSGANDEMNRKFFDIAFDDQQIEDLTLGKLNMVMKVNVNDNNSSKPNFSLLGDPALKMAYPKYEVYTTHINGVPVNEFTGTLQALQEAEFSGYVGDHAGNKLTDFDGFVYPTVFDKKTTVFTQNNDDGSVQQFQTFNKNIFKGKASVASGDFSFKFVVPYDINYTVGKGRVSYYAVAGNRDAHGYYGGFDIGGSLNGAQLNTVGPEIELYMNDSLFVNGGVTSSSPILLGRLKDENGINTVGNGIGHDITAILDNDTQNPIILNEYYETDLNTYQQGEVRYQLTDLTSGEHNLTFKAWDVHNNSSNASLSFVVAENSSIALEHVLNYPNPFTTNTQFMFEHNQACTQLEVRIQIFTVSGKLVKTIEHQTHTSGYRVDGINWDGRDDFGDQIGRGVYVYKVEIKNELGEKAEQFEKLVILK
jgi:Peptidase family C25